jgi:hypothetical protein
MPRLRSTPHSSTSAPPEGRVEERHVRAAADADLEDASGPAVERVEREAAEIAGAEALRGRPLEERQEVVAPRGRGRTARWS